MLWELCDSSLKSHRFFRRYSFNIHCMPSPELDAGVTKAPKTLAPVLGTLRSHGQHKGDISIQ